MNEFRKSKWERTPKVDEHIRKSNEAFDCGNVKKKSATPKNVLEQLVDREDPEKRLEAKELREGIEEILDSIKNPRDALILRLRYGFLDHPSVTQLGISPGDKEDFTYKKIGEFIGLDGSHVAQIESNVLRDLFRYKGRKLALKHMDSSIEDIRKQQLRRYLRGGPHPRE